ncbi:unnamed protein product [Cuscuta campestris]|uniref:Chromo domain-containing protein n=1 Tax=Cuscuta campestris TaxID=132261 RepID=A0A484KYF3_9ASTE|nr:unnamed protein product [Cuscuta campestris]
MENAQNNQLKVLLEQQLASQNQKIEEQQKMLEKIMEMMEKSSSNEHRYNSEVTGMERGEKNPFKFVPKVEFPVFNGSNPRNWIKKCARYFSLCKIPEEQRLDLASIHLVGKAETWFASYITVKKGIGWDEFIFDLCGRFKDELDSKVVEEFNKWSQEGTIDAYLERFEELKALMLQRTPMLPEEYFVDSFVGGLKSHIKPFVKALKPQSLDEAVQFARLQEEALQATRNMSKPLSSRLTSSGGILPTPKGAASYNSNSSLTGYKNSANSETSSTTSTTRSFRPTRILSAAERAEKSAKGLCYFCDEPYEKGHKCQTRKTQLFLVEIPGDDLANDEEEALLDGHNEFEILETEPCISFHAVNGITGYQTMRVTGHVGVQWLSTLGTIKWNFKELQMEFHFKGKGHILRGLQGPKLKEFRGVFPNKPHIPEGLQGRDVAILVKPVAVLERRIVKQGNKAAVQYLVQWEGQSVEDASWRNARDFEQEFPEFFST